MKTIIQTGAGEATHEAALRDSDGTGTLPIQAEVSGAATFLIRGRVSPEAPWFTLRDASSADFLETISWVPYLQLVVTDGTGTVRLLIGEK